MIEDESGDDLRDLTVEGRTFRVSGDDRMEVTVPFMEDGHLVIVMGAPLEAAISKCLLSSGESLADGQFAFPKGEMGAWVDLRPLWHLLDQAMQAAGVLGDLLDERAPVLRVIQGAALQSLGEAEDG